MEIPEILQGAALYLEGQYGFNFGLLIAPLAALILLVGIYYFLFREKQEIPEIPGTEHEFLELEKEMLILNEQDRRAGLVSVGCNTCHIKTPHTHRERVTDYL
ncbi:hypothetical protein IIC68_02565 [archaeon]|nr:hypothetical protein [archaeon]